MEFKTGTRVVNGKTEFFVTCGDMECYTPHYSAHTVLYRKGSMESPITADRKTSSYPIMEVDDINRWIGHESKNDSSSWDSDRCDLYRFTQRLLRSYQNDTSIAMRFVQSTEFKFLLQAPRALREFQTSTFEYEQWRNRMEEHKKNAQKLLIEFETDYPTDEDVTDVDMELSDNDVLRSVARYIQHKS